MGASPDAEVPTSVKRASVGSASGLSEKDLASHPDEEIDRAHEALFAQPDHSDAVNNKVIESAAPKVADYSHLSAKELVAGANKEHQTLKDNAARVAQIRQNHADLLAARAFHSPKEFLKTVAGGKLKNVDPAFVTVAKELLKHNKVDWDKITTQVGGFTDKSTPDGRASWSALTTTDGEGHNVWLNLEAKARRGIVGSYVHELLHTLQRDKIDGKIKMNSVEEGALGRIKQVYEEVLGKTGISGTPEEIAKQASEKAKGVYAFNHLTNLQEFVEGLSEGSPDLQSLMEEHGYAGRAVKSGKDSRFATKEEVKQMLTEFSTGKKADPNSQLAKAMTSAWNFTHFTPNEIHESDLHGALNNYRAREKWVQEQIAARGLEGSSAVHDSLRDEWNKANTDKPTGGGTPKGDALASRDTPRTNDEKADYLARWYARKQVGFEKSPTTKPDSVHSSLENYLKEGLGPDVGWKATPDILQKANARLDDAIAFRRKYEAGRDSQPLASAADRGETSGESLMRLAREKGQDMFHLPHQLSESLDLRENLNSTGHKFSTFEMDGADVISEVPKVGDAVMYPDNGTYGGGTAIRSEGGRITVKPSNGGPDQTYPEHQVVAGRRFVKVYPPDPKNPDRVVVDSSSGAYEGGIPHTRRIYQGIYQWAHNSGKVIVPDSPTSWAGHFRRNAHQISSALRNQSADHFEPTTDQLERMYPEVTGKNADQERLDRWNYEQTPGKIEALARAEKSYVEQKLPEAVQYKYDPKTDLFHSRTSGDVLHRSDFEQRLSALSSDSQKSGTADSERIGESTFARYLAARAAVEGEQGLRDTGASNSGSLNKILYSAADTGLGLLMEHFSISLKSRFYQSLMQLRRR